MWSTISGSIVTPWSTEMSAASIEPIESIRSLTRSPSNPRMTGRDAPGANPLVDTPGRVSSTSPIWVSSLGITGYGGCFSVRLMNRPVQSRPMVSATLEQRLGAAEIPEGCHGAQVPTAACRISYAQF